MFGQVDDRSSSSARVRTFPSAPTPPPPRPDENTARIEQPLQGAAAADPSTTARMRTSTAGWRIEPELAAMVDQTVAEFRGDARRVYVTGLSRGGFGAWHFAARHPEKVAALAPVVGFGHPDLAEPIAKAKLPLWQFAGGRDPAVPVRADVSAAQPARGARASAGSLHRARGPRPFHLGARLRRPGRLHVDAVSLENLKDPRHGDTQRTVSVDRRRRRVAGRCSCRDRQGRRTAAQADLVPERAHQAERDYFVYLPPGHASRRTGP